MAPSCKTYLLRDAKADLLVIPILQTLVHRGNVPAYTLIATTPSEDFKKGGDGSSSGSGRQATNLVFTALIITLIRLEKVKTDIVITINVPHIKGEYDEDDMDLELGNKGELIGNAIEHAAKIWESFAIKNYGLFGREHEHMAYEELG